MLKFWRYFVLFLPIITSTASASKKEVAYSFESYHLTVDCKLLLEEMITAGQYTFVDNSNITTGNFPLSCNEVDKKEVEVVLVSFETSSDIPQTVNGIQRKTTVSRTVSTKYVLEFLMHHGLRSATIEELLALGMMYPGLQLKYPIVALGSSARIKNWRDGKSERRVPFLGRSSAGRELRLSWWEGEWGVVFSFLAVRY